MLRGLFFGLHATRRFLLAGLVIMKESTMNHRPAILTIICLAAIFFTIVSVPSVPAGDPPPFKVIPPGFTVHHIPEGQEIVFMAMSARQINIYLCKADRSAVPLLKDRRMAKYPSPSQDGRLIYFESAETLPYTGKPMSDEERKLVANNPLFMSQIYTHNPLTGEHRRISDGNTLDSFPVSSPDGSRVAFCSRPPDRKTPWRIVLMDRDGSNRQALTPDTDSGQTWPTWSPDALKIAYLSMKTQPGKAGEVPARKMTLRVHDLESDTNRSIPGLDDSIGEPSWSPLGEWLAFGRFDMKTHSYSLWKIRPDGTGLERITEGPGDHHPSWMPDGQALLFARGAAKLGGKKEICMVDIRTGRISRLISDKDASLEYPHCYPAVAPERHARL
jgi:Tol biopolymer transport system component